MKESHGYFVDEEIHQQEDEVEDVFVRGEVGKEWRCGDGGGTPYEGPVHGGY